MPETTPGNIKDKLKIAGGVVLVCASVGLFIKKLPKQQYAEVHADKPRPRATDSAAQAAKPASKPATPPAQKPAAQTAPTPLKAGPTALDTASLALPEQAEPLEEVDIVAACKAESGIFCYQVPDENLPPCLGRYTDVLLKDCRSALEGLTPKPAKPAKP